jgi:hypothetical protein
LVAARQRPVANPDNDGSNSDDSGEEVELSGETESSEEEVVVGNIGSSGNLSSSDGEMLVTTTRSGRVAGSCKNAFYH